MVGAVMNDCYFLLGCEPPQRQPDCYHDLPKTHVVCLFQIVMSIAWEHFYKFLERNTTTDRPYFSSGYDLEQSAGVVYLLSQGPASIFVDSATTVGSMISAEQRSASLLQISVEEVHVLAPLIAETRQFVVAANPPRDNKGMLVVTF